MKKQVSTQGVIVLLLLLLVTPIYAQQGYACIPGFAPTSSADAGTVTGDTDVSSCGYDCQVNANCQGFAVDSVNGCRMYSKTYDPTNNFVVAAADPSVTYCVKSANSQPTCIASLHSTANSDMTLHNLPNAQYACDNICYARAGCLAFEVDASGNCILHSAIPSVSSSNSPSAVYCVRDPCLQSTAFTCTQSCASYDPFSDSLSPAFPPTVTVAATQIDNNMNSIITVTLVETATAPVRYLLLATAPEGVGSISDFGGDAATFWDNNDLSTCSTVQSITIDPVTDCGAATTTSTTVTYACTVYAALLSPNPLDSSRYLATVNAINVPYTFDEIVDSSNDVNVIGVFCGVSVTSLSCVSTSSVLSNAVLVSVSNATGVNFTNCVLDGSDSFRITCTLIPDSVPLSVPFIASLYDDGGNQVTVGQRINIPKPSLRSVNDSAVSLSALPAVIGNKDNLQFTVTTKIGGTVNVLSLTATKPDSTVDDLHGCWSQDPSGGAGTVTVTWNIACSIANDVHLYDGSLTLQVSTLVTSPGTGNDARVLMAQGTHNSYTADTVNVGVVQLSQDSTTTGTSTASTATTSHSPITEIVVPAAAALLACVAVVATVIVFKRRKSPQPKTKTMEADDMTMCSPCSVQSPDSGCSNPLAGGGEPAAATTTVLVPMEDKTVDVVELDLS